VCLVQIPVRLQLHILLWIPKSYHKNANRPLSAAWSADCLWDVWGMQVGADEGTAQRAIFGRGIRSFLEDGVLGEGSNASQPNGRRAVNGMASVIGYC